MNWSDGKSRGDWRIGFLLLVALRGATRRLSLIWTAALICGAVVTTASSVAAWELTGHPRIFVNSASLKVLALRSEKELASEYGLLKAKADRTLKEGVRNPDNRFRTPEDLLSLGICYLVEREKGHEADAYARAAVDFWGDGEVLTREGSGHFGYYAMVYDWIFDAMTPEERIRFGNAIGPWLRYYTDTPEITLKNGHWWYNQTWGPAHLNTPNTRDGITPKLMLALALHGAGTEFDDDARRFLDSWAKRVPEECIPAFNESGGVWTESMGHGGYGPVVVIPWAFEAWRTATGEDLFQAFEPTGYLPQITRWAVHLVMPFSDHTAWIDDGRAGRLSAFARVAAILGARYKDPVANGVSDQAAREAWDDVPWNRFLSYDPTVGSSTPGESGYPTAELFKESGHVYMRSAWDDPNATWAFFGVGPKFAGHARDDEGSFLIADRGHIALRAGGQGHNDWDYYVAGSLAYNLVTIFDPEEEFRRLAPGGRNLERGTKNERDGGLIRYVYTSHTRNERGRITTFDHGDRWTYAAADITEGYRPSKVREVTRQFLFLREPRSCFVIFDRIDATKGSFPKTWFLHTPGEPSVSGKETVLTPEHVFSYDGDSATWLSDPAGDENVLSAGRTRAFLKTALPEGATLTKRGGTGHDFWGHPHEPTAQYNHVSVRSGAPPIVPWRLEVEAPLGSERDVFLHVIELAPEDQKTMSATSLVQDGNEVGVRIEFPEGPVEVRFTQTGDTQASIRFGDEQTQVLSGSD